MISTDPMVDDRLALARENQQSRECRRSADRSTHGQKMGPLTVSSTNAIERVNAELDRRVVGIFPNTASLVRLFNRRPSRPADEWQDGRRHCQSAVDVPAA